MLQTTFRNALTKMQFGDVTQPPDAQAKFSRVSATLLLAWQPRPKVPWAGRAWGDGCRWLLGGREVEGLPMAHHVTVHTALPVGLLSPLSESSHLIPITTK